MSDPRLHFDGPVETREQLARVLADQATRLRELVLGELGALDLGATEEGPLARLAARHREVSGDPQPAAFADAYAQTITYGSLASCMGLAARTDPLFEGLVAGASPVVRGQLGALRAGLEAVDLDRVFAADPDPVLHFYEDFLDAYAPSLRRTHGVYYTPDALVRTIVDRLDGLARTRLGLRLGLADPIRWGAYAEARGLALPAGVGDEDFVVTVLDPAAGTGTFLLRVLERVFATMRAEFRRAGLDEVAAAAAWGEYVRGALVPRIAGFELMAAPAFVARLRLTFALERGLARDAELDPGLWGVALGQDEGPRVFTTNALDPRTSAGEAEAEDEAEDEGGDTGEAGGLAGLKYGDAILIILGNPPYERVSTEADPSAAWILDGDVPGRPGGQSLFEDIRAVARAHTVFSHLRSLPDRYVYFWRWALWRTFEVRDGPGLIALVTNNTWLRGPGFVGLRKIIREQADALWTLDLGGDSRGPRVDANVFGIETPVAITIACRDGVRDSSQAAEARYCKVEGDDAAAKLADLGGLTLDGPRAVEAETGWLASLVPPAGDASWQGFVALTDLFPWQQPGCLAARTWPIAPEAETLARRWARFVGAPADARPELFATAKTGRNIFTKVPGLAPLASLEADAPPAAIVRYGLRSFDRQWILADPRVLKTESPSLWRSRSDRQVFLCSLMSVALGPGPALTVTAHVPDFHHFRGSYGGKDVLPLYRDADAREPNLTRGLAEAVAAGVGIEVPTPEDFAAYVYALLGGRPYQARFAAALATPGPRVPVSADAKLWHAAVGLGRRLLWLHTYAARFCDPSEGRGPELPRVPGLVWSRPVDGLPASLADVAYDPAAGVLIVGSGRLAGVSPRVWDLRISGMQVVKKWLGYRTRRGAGRAGRSTNPLDRIRPARWCPEWSRELVELVTVLDRTLALEPEQSELLDAICSGPLIDADALPEPDADQRRVPDGRRS